jgi:hypothetical protein
VAHLLACPLKLQLHSPGTFAPPGAGDTAGFLIAGIVREAFAAQIDLTYVGGIERGKRNPSLLIMARVADALSDSPAKIVAE